MSRSKTYFSAEEQYERTFALCSLGYKALNVAPAPETDKIRLSGHYFGIITVSHRLFLPGDLVVYIIDNGAAERFPVWSISSKGYRICGLYLQFQRWGDTGWKGHGVAKAIWLPGQLPGSPEKCIHCLPADDPAAQTYYSELRALETLPRRGSR